MKKKENVLRTKPKRLKIVIFSILLILGSFTLYGFLIGDAQDSTVTIRQIDEDGTLIKTPTTLVGRFLQKFSFDTTISGYSPVTHQELTMRYPRMNKKMTKVYRPKMTYQDIQKRLSDSKFLGSYYDVLSSQPVNGVQFDDTDTKYNRMRIITSNDGKTWNKLNINYPNVPVRDDTLLWTGKKLFIYTTYGMFSTSNYKDWKGNVYRNEKLWDSFKSVWAPNVIDSASGKNYLVVTGNAKKQRTRKTYIAPINKSTGKISAVPTRLTIENGPTNVQSSYVSLVGQTYYLVLLTTKGHVELFKSNDLMGSFQKDDEIKLTSKKWTYRSPQLLSVNGQKRLYYTLIRQRDGASLGMRYRVINNHQIGQQKKVSNNFLTQNFNLRTNNEAKGMSHID
ncbi:hypothetical protein [Levilactobacillus bambusae]|uniref:Uncharacterized protein n=1 Tax=Levilactobacillus bambusae TaxID=2024736 RepID=A0A2V1MXK5_9LACO|nr:hypothetical protein [Levilactobacillus bambusae]PWF99783.1 hypothetical protein DCM90_06900 [Levilactobacillus bambusae]